MSLFSFESTPLFIGVLGYLLYFSFLKSIFLKNKVSRLVLKSKASFFWIQLTRILAFFCMAILPIIFTEIYGIDFLEIYFTWTYTDSKYTFLLAVLLIPMGAINAKGKAHLEMYPQVRMLKWNPFEYIVNIVSWGLYLLAYEFLFRGILFLGIIPFTGLYTAIALNTILYALSHLYKGKKETLGSIPLGIILCFITAETETIWTAFAVHWIMATNNFIWSHWYTNNS